MPKKKISDRDSLLNDLVGKILIVAKMHFHYPFFLDDSYGQRDEVNRQADKQSKPGLAYQGNGYQFRNNIQEIIRMPETPEKE
jgi:hypothetical protein